LRAATWARSSLGFIALCDQGVVSVTNFVTAAIIARVCGKGEMGVYTLAWTLLTLATDISGPLTTMPYTVFAPQLTQDRRRQYLGSILAHQLVLSLVFAFTMAVGANVGPWRRSSVSGVVTTAAGAIVFVSLRELVRRVSLAELRIVWALAVDVAACATQAGGGVADATLPRSKRFPGTGIAWRFIRAGGWRLVVSPTSGAPSRRTGL
jgi:hypothetical protein